MSASKAIERILIHEGGFSDHSEDRGGRTNLGITESVARENGYHGDMRYLPREKAVEIYKRKYWDAAGCDQFAFPVGFQLFDACVNHGRGNAVRLLQRAAGVADDGIIGPRTKAAVAGMSPLEFCTLMVAERINFYTKLSTFKTFGAGWSNRMAQNLRYARDDCATR